MQQALEKDFTGNMNHLKEKMEWNTLVDQLVNWLLFEPIYTKAPEEDTIIEDFVR
jgi:hypothetical protein